MADSIDITVDWKALEVALKAAPDRLKASELRRILRAELKPVVNAARRMVPVRKGGVGIKRTIGKRLAQKGHSGFRKPGNLKKSIGVVASRKNAQVWARPRFGIGQTYDGYYGHMVHNGTQRTNYSTPFMRMAYNQQKAGMLNSSAKSVARAVAKALDRLNAKVK